ncbi:hypothetical protein P4U99_27060 [Brevibacillus agri]|uniref:hypothetical protein n=1 Tax=Brevibacillus agri TaxID=51101 RepID=UPI002E234EF7|nr:hypothetical protein [Brevibacillus agri]MED1656909.1 hypothetical protein [Brevibacillus agri]MED1686942.1 hypothetical protein [Brevibacillus agri]MED1690613.1 hypothetical protein [Brevibacillus agri]MED1700571.1 hypothetical protein [Brevibacillus agri]
MSLKAVELQVALPRTLEVSRIQEHQLQRSMHETQSMIDQRKDLDAHMRQRPANVDETQKNQIREREQGQQQKQEDPAHSASAEAKNAAAKEHSSPSSVSMRDPMRGLFIDISL